MENRTNIWRKIVEYSSSFWCSYPKLKQQQRLRFRERLALLKGLSIRTWTSWHGQQAFKVWLWEDDLIRAWTTWHGPASRPAKFDFWWGFRNSQPLQACWPWWGFQIERFQSEPGQGDMASKLSKFDFFSKFRSEPGQRDIGERAFKLWLLVKTSIGALLKCGGQLGSSNH